MGQDELLQRLAHGRSAYHPPAWTSSYLINAFERSTDREDVHTYKCASSSPNQAHELVFDPKGRSYHPAAKQLEKELADAQDIVTRTSLNADLEAAVDNAVEHLPLVRFPEAAASSVLQGTLQITTNLLKTIFHFYTWDYVVPRALLLEPSEPLPLSMSILSDLMQREVVLDLVTQALRGAWILRLFKRVDAGARQGLLRDDNYTKEIILFGRQVSNPISIS